MHDINLKELKDTIARQHENDNKQLEVIFSDSPRLIVEAPAGYGKTTTMISRIAYLFATNGIPNPKRILGLTFSINAALKVKREVSEKLPALLGSKENPLSINERVAVTNYHGFCKSVLKKYGYLIDNSLRKDINLFRGLGAIKNDKGSIYPDWKGIADKLSSTEQQTIFNLDSKISSGTFPSADEITSYIEIVKNKLLPADCITHNAVILFVLDIFTRKPEVQKFYQSFYPLIVVDEFQDTNCIAWALLQAIISEETQLLFLGDPLQRIYGFIGALPNIMATAETQFKMSKITLDKNYRFRDNPEMLKLDKNIRANAATCFSPVIANDDVAQLPTFCGQEQQNEAQKVVERIQALLTNNKNRVAILFNRRGKNVEIFETELTNKNVQYFYGMFTDEDADYVAFHIKCQNMFIKKFGERKNINKKALISFAESIKKEYVNNSEKTISSLLKLLDAFIEKVSVDYADILTEDKYSLILDIFENRQLKQAMEYVDSRVILSTIHGAKGLEWDYVIVADVEQWVMTLLCYDCTSTNKNGNQFFCQLPQTIPQNIKSKLLDDLCVFYVALTRAREQAYISASVERFNAQGKKSTNGKLCCFATIKGLKPIKADE
jgi:DNA helicase-2/ATP-dependent DNA helicase PcrA